MRLHFALLVSCAWCVSCASRAPDVPVLVAPIPKPQPHPDKPVIVRAAEPVAAPEPSVVPSCASAPRDPRVKDPRRAVALVAAEHAALGQGVIGAEDFRHQLRLLLQRIQHRLGKGALQARGV